MRNHKLGESSLTNLATGTSDLQALAHEAMRIANSRKLPCCDFGVLSVLRTRREQYTLFMEGRTKIQDNWVITSPSDVVTYCDGSPENESIHQSGDALDFVCYVNGKLTWESKYYLEVVTCFFEAAGNLGLLLDWGGSYKSMSDLGHVNIIR